ncbi:hypothetical protein ES703_67526 [subsurface metagenome]
MSRSVNIFGEAELSQYFDQLKAVLKQTISNEAPEYLMNVNVDDYSEHLVNKFKVEPLQIHFNRMYIDTCEKPIPAERHPRSSFDLRGGGSFMRQVITYHIPYEGKEELLQRIPNPRLGWTYSVDLQENCICFDIINFYNDSERIKRDADGVTNRMRQQLDNIRQNVDAYNNQLPGLVKTIINERHQQLATHHSIATSLGVPIKKSSNVPETFSVPSVKKKVVPKPVVPPIAGPPEPTLDQETYEDVLRVINDTGKVMERLPSTYANKDEEALRDHLIMVLEPNFEGSTTGETFNRAGKTDILIRHENSNVFVAECKFWAGRQKHLATIDQLLTYLTWRDSKTAVICFVDRQNFT